jgi:hypothetical protein
MCCLGDSYTIGEGVPTAYSFPHLLRAMIAEKSEGKLDPSVKVVAKTGWTTNELSDAIAAEEKGEDPFKPPYELVTLLIGVNNEYRGPEKDYTLERYQTEFTSLLDTAISFAGGDCSKLRVVSIPDWGRTTFGLGSGRDTALISKELDEYNAFAKGLCEQADKNIKFVDITPYSRTVVEDTSYLVEDGLHYSALFNKEVATLLLATLSV